MVSLYFSSIYKLLLYLELSVIKLLASEDELLVFVISTICQITSIEHEFSSLKDETFFQ